MKTLIFLALLAPVSIYVGACSVFMITFIIPMKGETEWLSDKTDWILDIMWEISPFNPDS